MSFASPNQSKLDLSQNIDNKITNIQQEIAKSDRNKQDAEDQTIQIIENRNSDLRKQLETEKNERDQQSEEYIKYFGHEILKLQELMVEEKNQREQQHNNLMQSLEQLNNNLISELQEENETRQNAEEAMVRLLEDTYSANIKNETCSDFNVDDGSVVTESQRINWMKTQEMLAKRRGDNEIAKFLKNEQNESDMTNQVIYYVLPYLILAVVSIFGFFLYCCGKWCCANTGCFKQKEQYNGFSKYWPGIGIIITMLSIIASSISGLATSADIQQTYNTIFCTGQIALYGLTYGDETGNSDSYIGIINILEKLEFFVDNHLDKLLSDTGNSFPHDISWIEDRKENLDYIQEQMYLECSQTGGSDCCSQAVCSGDWINTSNSPIEFSYSKNPDFDQPVVFRDSGYFSGEKDSIWGKSAQIYQKQWETVFNIIKTSITNTENQGQKINNMSDIKDSVDDALNSMKIFEDKIYKNQEDLYNYQQDNQSYLSAFKIMLGIFLIIFMILAVINIIALIIIYWKKYYKLRIIYNIQWVFFSIFMVILFLLTAACWVSVLYGEQSCEILHKILNNPNDYWEYTGRMDENIRDKIFICKSELNTSSGEYKGDDNILIAFNAQEEINVVSDMREKITEFDNKIGNASDNYQELEFLIADTTLNDDLNYLYEYQEYIDYKDNIGTEHQDLKSGINEINSNLQTCSISATYEKQCQNNPSDFSSDNTGCFEIQDDYNNNFSTCSGMDDRINAVEEWRNEKNNIVNLKLKQTISLQNELQVLQDYLDSYIDNIQMYNQETLDALDFIAAKDSGLIYQLHCFWFGEQVDNFYDAFCVSFTYTVYKVTVFITWFAFSLFFASFFLCVASKRFAFQAHKNNVQVQAQNQNNYNYNNYRK
ncbi:hypothetical protein PPERSA_00327 [Pseudocohnilembus persalinus]|uniref:Transmembrane protein n=1 Tax=Pseudocohnilembus persalinus TaxID=266149 RepID=A0A0V0QHG4_PSEPJ|nr:hypothetical protein PPERSA_00327 [Pseudocohnilembus persalinus]|eukprot:KRX01620.1 hypothetical protein PPERSA_00327 [Pseudocohnilembus persalinus]